LIIVRATENNCHSYRGRNPNEIRFTKYENAGDKRIFNTGYVFHDDNLGFADSGGEIETYCGAALGVKRPMGMKRLRKQQTELLAAD